MFTVINDNLFSIGTTHEHNGYGDFVKLRVSSAENFVRKIDQTQTKSTPITIVTLVSPTADYSAYNMKISSRLNDFGRPSVLVKCDDKYELDQSVVVIAFPFNGIVRPIPESKQFRLYKGALVKSDEYSIQSHGRRYRNILYLVISPNMLLFDPVHLFHSEEIKIPLESYSTMFDKQSDQNKTLHETFTVTITRDQVTYDWAEETLESFDAAPLKAQQMFSVYKPPSNNQQGQSNQQPAAANSSKENFQKNGAAFENKLGSYFKPYLDDPDTPDYREKGHGKSRKSKKRK